MLPKNKFPRTVSILALGLSLMTAARMTETDLGDEEGMETEVSQSALEAGPIQSTPQPNQCKNRLQGCEYWCPDGDGGEFMAWANCKADCTCPPMPGCTPHHILCYKVSKKKADKKKAGEKKTGDNESY